ncbi:MAG: hypothetical protein JW982_05910, partial [Spirochaetes bacterium]|nr:hypothetical protein [Spirochaetota bacterium]
LLLKINYWRLMMKKIVFSALIVLLTSGIIFAQDSKGGKLSQGDWGFGTLLTTSSSALQLHYFVNDSLAIKPSLFLDMYNREFTDNLGNSSNTTKGYNGSPSYGAGIDVDYYMNMKSSLYMFTGAGISYRFGSYEYTADPSTIDKTTDYHYILGNLHLGAQYMINDVVGIFAVQQIACAFAVTTVDNSGTTSEDQETKTVNIYTNTTMLGIVFNF